MNTAGKPLLTEAVAFFSDRGICKEMLFPEFEALLDGLVATPEFADETIEAVFLQISHRLHVRAAVFFTIDFDPDGYANRLWNLPLRTLAEKASRGPDMGEGPIRLVCLGFTSQPQYRPHLWKPGHRNGRADLALIKEAVRRNVLGIVGEDEDSLAVIAAENLQIAAEDAWYGGGNVVDAVRLPTSKEDIARESLEKVMAERDEQARKVALYARQLLSLQEQLRSVKEQHDQAVETLKLEHAAQLAVIQGELRDVKTELEHQHKLNTSLKRDLNRQQNRTPID
jgi:hypothetical protein